MRKQKTLKLILSVFIFILFAAGHIFAAGYSITAQVDKSEVGFGESLNLVITIVQELNRGVSNQLHVPQINSIPNFDIAGTRSSQEQSWINGVGQIKVQTLLELVPQKPGNFNIPSFKIKGPDGKSYQTDAIAIKVLPPSEDSESEPESTSVTTTQKEGSSSFKLLLIAGLVFGMIVAVPFLLASLMNRGQKPSIRRAEEQKDLKSSGLTSKTDKVVRNEVEDAIIANETEQKPNEEPVTKVVRRVNFDEEVNNLKRLNPEVNKEFYQQYFGLFKLSLIGQCSFLSEDMTPDEILKKAEEICSSATTKEAISRIAKDQELVLFANMVPERSFNAIHNDTKNILISIS